MNPVRPYSRKEIPGLTFIFSLPEAATSPHDFKDEAPCTLWKPVQVYARGDEGKNIISPTGNPVKILTYEKGAFTVPFKELVSSLVAHGDQFLKWGSIFEIRLALPMGLDEPGKTFEHDLWRLGYVSMPDFKKTKERRGLRQNYGYYLLQKRVAGTPLRYDTEEDPLESSRFIGAERDKWSNRFKRF